MEVVHVYLSGGMSGLSMEEQNKWRLQVINAIKYNNECEKKPVFFNPVDHYNFEEQYHKSEREIFEYDLYNLRKSDVVIVNFNNPSSIGTAAELILAKEYHIPVIAFGVDGKDIHSWLLECCTRVCDDLREAVSHVVDYYLN